MKKLPATAFWFSLPALLLLAVPFVTLMAVTQWRDMHLSWGDPAAIATSLGLGMCSLVLIIISGLPVAWWLAQTRSRARGLVEALVMIPLLTPPLALGILLISAYGPYSLPGELLRRAGWELVNNPAAFIVAQWYGAVPYFIVTARAAFADIPRDVLEVAETLGAAPAKIFTRLVLPLAARGLAAAIALTWVRAIGEFGIVMIFAWFPQGIPVQLYNNLQNSGVDAVYVLVWLLLLFTLPVPLLCFFISRRLGESAS